MSGRERASTIRLEISIDSDDDLEILRGALLAARATELSEIQRRAGRLSYGYGTDSARATMSDEVDVHEPAPHDDRSPAGSPRGRQAKNRVT